MKKDYTVFIINFDTQLLKPVWTIGLRISLPSYTGTPYLIGVTTFKFESQILPVNTLLSWQKEVSIYIE